MLLSFPSVISFLRWWSYVQSGLDVQIGCLLDSAGKVLLHQLLFLFHALWLLNHLCNPPLPCLQYIGVSCTELILKGVGK